VPLMQRGGHPIIPLRWPNCGGSGGSLIYGGGGGGDRAGYISAPPPLITIMVSTPPPKCPVLPDGRALTAAFVGMDEDRFSSMFANDVQVLCASWSDCKVHSGLSCRSCREVGIQLYRYGGQTAAAVAAASSTVAAAAATERALSVPPLH
jgi:hypothetical protein